MLTWVIKGGDVEIEYDCEVEFSFESDMGVYCV